MIRHVLGAFSFKFSTKGYVGLMLMASSTIVEKFSVSIAMMTAVLGLVLVCYNIAIKVKEYNIKKIELKKLEDNE